MAGEDPYHVDEVALPTGGTALAARTLLEERYRALRRSVDRPIAHTDLVVNPTPAESRGYLFEEACELYLNELNWEELTDEEKVEDGELTEMVFPGLLAFLDALLPRNPNGEPDRDREHRDVVHDFLLWLAARLVHLRDPHLEAPGDRALNRREALIADDLVDLLVARLHDLTGSDLEAYRR